MGNSCVLLEVTPGPSQASAVNGLLIAILIERARISCVVYVLVCSGLWSTDWKACPFIMLRWPIFNTLPPWFYKINGHAKLAWHFTWG